MADTIKPEVERELAHKYADALTKRDLNHEKAIINNIMDQIQDEVKAIPEPVFRELFLPYFTGEKQMTAEQNAAQHWMGLVGSPTMPADVVNIKGEVLFTVPPLIDTSNLNTLNKDRRQGFASIFINFQEQAKLHANLGVQELSQGLARKTGEIMPEPGTPTSSQYSWNGCLNYYRAQGLINDGVQVAQPNQAVSAAPGDEDMTFND